jgi:tRNA 2-thiouridine synthesizing protein E
MPAHSRWVRVNDKPVHTDAEGYLKNLDDWSEDYAMALAKEEGLLLTDQHWQVIQFLRDYFAEHNVQAQVRVMVKHFSEKWGTEMGSNRRLHDMFPKGGPQKQGNRLAGLMRTRGEH